MQTIEIDDETYTSLEMLAREEHASIGSVVKRAVSRLPRVLKSSASSPAPPSSREHKIPISKGSRPFTMEDVYAIEDDNDMRGIS